MHTKIPPAELEVFEHLPGIKVLVDVGARADMDYARIKPGITVHAFEPNPDFFEQLTEAAEGLPNIHLNNYGLSDTEGTIEYSDQLQAYKGGEAPTSSYDRLLPLKTLDWYIEENNVRKIDFLKVDVEGYDYKVFLGAPKALKISRFVQYEYWDNPGEFEVLLKEDFDMEYIGYRNVLCMNKKLVPEKTRAEIIDFIRFNNYKDLA